MIRVSLTSISFVVAAFIAVPMQLAVFADEPKKPVRTSVSGDSVMAHIKILASDRFEGRAPGAVGGDLAAAYIESHFARVGLEKFGASYRQDFFVPAALKLGNANALLSGKQRFKLGVDFMPLGYSSSKTVSASEIVFVGYGIESGKYSDYAGVEVKGKVVAMFRQSPDGNNPHSEFYEASSLWRKLNVAREKGASAVLLVSGALDFEDDKLMELTRDKLAADAGIPAMHITRRLAASLLHTTEQSLETLQKNINQTKLPSSFVVKRALKLTVDVVREKNKTANLVGYLPATDSACKNDYIIIGAHYDHLGYGGDGSGSLAPDEKKIHYGADDNASGTAGVLELARVFAAERATLKRNLVFICFGAEEMGLLGSAHYVQSPLAPLDKTLLMLNMDMIGRMKDSALAVGGVGTAKELSELCNAENIDALKLKFSQDGYGPSDHSSFYGKGIPVLFFFTGTHANYHKPSDTWDKINAQGEEKILEYASRIVRKVDAMPTRLTFTRAQADSLAQGSRSSTGGFRISLGTIPNYAKEVDGVELDGVREGSLAEKSGLKGGDIIIKFGEKPIRNIYDYTDAIRQAKPGDKVVIVVMRGKEKVEIPVEFPAKGK